MMPHWSTTKQVSNILSGHKDKRRHQAVHGPSYIHRYAAVYSLDPARDRRILLRVAMNETEEVGIRLLAIRSLRGESTVIALRYLEIADKSMAIRTAAINQLRRPR